MALVFQYDQLTLVKEPRVEACIILYYTHRGLSFDVKTVSLTHLNEKLQLYKSVSVFPHTVAYKVRCLSGDPLTMAYRVFRKGSLTKKQAVRVNGLRKQNPVVEYNTFTCEKTHMRHWIPVVPNEAVC